MEQQDTVILITIISAVVSLLGQFFQYIFAPKKHKSETDTDVAAILKNVTESYDKLFESLKYRIRTLEETAEKEAKGRLEATIENAKLAEEIKTITRKMERQKEEISTLKQQLNISKEQER